MLRSQTAPLFQVFKDAWAAANGPAGGFSIPVEKPNRRIDYIFTNKKGAKVFAHFLQQSSQAVAASMHGQVAISHRHPAHPVLLAAQLHLSSGRSATQNVRKCDDLYGAGSVVVPQVQEVYVPQDDLTEMTSDHLPVVGQLKLDH